MADTADSGKQVTMAGEPQVAGRDAGLIKDTTTAAFRQDVITESARLPVLVLFWAPTSSTSKQLTEVLEKIVREAAGKTKLVKMNTGEHPQIASQLGVQAIPAVYAFQRGQPVDGFVGSLPEVQVRGFVERLVGPLSDAITEALADAQAAIAVGDAEAAAALFAQVLEQDEANVKAIAGLAKLYVEAGELEEARGVLAMTPAGKETDTGIVAANAALDLAEQAGSVGDLGALEAAISANPKDHQARFDLALGLNGLGKREEAADQLLEIFRRERTWNEDAARKQLLQFFEAWGVMDPASLYARRRLSSLLYS